MKHETNYYNLISTQVNSLTLDQLNLLFQVYLELDYKCNFFMSQNTHQEFMNRLIETPKCSYTYKSLINLLATAYTYEHRYPHVLKTIDMIKNNYTLITIINVLYQNR